MAEDRTDPYEPLTDEEGNHVFDESYFRAWARSIGLEIRTHVPATIMQFNAQKNTVNCTVDFLQTVKARDGVAPTGAVAVTGEGADTNATLPAFELRDIRVAWPGCKKGRITLPLEPGDHGHIHVSDRAMARWYKEGKPVDPVNALIHQLRDGVFYPSPLTDADTTPVDMTAAVFHHDSGVKLHKDADKEIALARLVFDFVKGVITAGVPAAMDGGVALRQSMLEYINAKEASLPLSLIHI